MEYCPKFLKKALTKALVCDNILMLTNILY